MIGPLARVLVSAAALDLATIVFVLAVSAARGKLDAPTVGEWLVWSGLAAAVIGGLAVRGAWDSRSAHVGFAASAGRAGITERAQHAADDVGRAYRRLLFMLLVGAPLVALGIWIDPRI